MKKEMDIMKDRIKKLRKQFGLTQQVFADRLCIKRGAIANYEIGRNKPTDAVVSLICREFNVSEEWLRTGEGEPFIINSMNDRIKKLRTMLGLSQTDFAEKLNLSRNFINQVETSKKNFSNRTILDVCRKFDVNEEWLRTGEGKPFIERAENYCIAAFMADVLSENDTFRKRFLEAQASLTDEDWLVIEKIVDKISKK